MMIVRSIYPKKGDSQYDCMLLKSRDMGATWICALVYLWFLLFWPERLEFFCMSYKEDLVDGGGKSIFGKMDFCLEHLPSWLLPGGTREGIKRTNLLIMNLKTGSTIEGESTTGRSGVGGRFASMFFDEFQLVEQDTSVYEKSANCTESRIFNGTPNGTHTQFYRLSRMEHVKKVELHWTQHAFKAQGLPMIDGPWSVARWRQMGKPQNDWYRRACQKLGNNQQAIAENLDIDFKSAGWTFFQQTEIDRLVSAYARPPKQVGVLVGKGFQDNPGGHMRLWCDLLPSGRPPKGRYGVACDVASGVGGKESTPSTVCVVNLETGQKVAELSDPFLHPHRFAKVVENIARWFHDALIIWENAGPTGAAFRKSLIEDLGYGRIYLRKAGGHKLTQEITDEPGWYPTDEAKGALLEFYREALSDGTFCNPSKQALEECMQFVYDGRTIVHSLDKVKNDPSGAKANHGDLVIADALANLLVKEDGAVARNAKLKEGDELVMAINPPYGSMAWRDRMEEQFAETLDGWGRD